MLVSGEMKVIAFLLLTACAHTAPPPPQAEQKAEAKDKPKPRPIDSDWESFLQREGE